MCHEDVFNENQLFAIFILENGGCDLEHSQLRDLLQAKSILFQLIASLHWAESHYEFEHRDLHLGNVLLQEVQDSDKSVFVYNLDTKSHGRCEFNIYCQAVRILIIDYTLSRLRTSRCLYYIL
jgi:hypothetical protein